MLQHIRDKAKGVVAWVIVILIIIPFALWGVDQFAAGDKIDVSAKVNGEPVLTQEVLRAFDRVKRQYQEQFGDMYASLVQEDDLRKQVLEDLVLKAALDHQAQEEGFAISDELLRQVVQSQRMFQDKGQFSLSRYEEVLRSNAYTPERFEREQRAFMQRNQLETMASSSEFIGDRELAALARLELQEREVGYLRVDHRPFLTQVQVGEEAVAAYYEANKDLFREAEKVSVDMLRLSAEDLMKGIQVSEEEIKAYYQANLDKFDLPEKRSARHILIMAAADADPMVDKTAKEKAEALLTRLQSGEDFAQLAKENSDDPGSAQQGGSLGFFSRGDMVPEFEQAVFGLKVAGDLAPVVRSQFGYHLIQLEGIEKAERPPLDKVRHLLIDELKGERALKAYNDALDKLKTLTYEQPDTLEPAAQALGLKVVRSPAFDRQGGEGVFADNRVVEAAFSDVVLKDKLNSAVVEVQAGDAVVVRLADYQPAHDRALDEVRADIRLKLQREEARKLAKSRAHELLAKASATADPAALVAEGIEWKSSDWMARNTPQMLPEIVTAAFRAPKPAAGKSSWVEHQLSTGDSLLIRVSGVRVDDARVKEVTAELRDAGRQVFGDATADAINKVIKQAAKVEYLKQP